MMWCRNCGEDIAEDPSGILVALEPYNDGPICPSSHDGAHHPYEAKR